MSIRPLFFSRRTLWIKRLGAIAICLGSFVSHAQSTAPSGLVPLAQINIPERFERIQLTRENFGAFARACLPTYPESEVDKFVAGWRLPLKNSTTTISESRSAGFIQIRDDFGVCVTESENRHPIIAAEALQGTANPDALPQAEQLEVHRQLAKLLAERGFAEVSYVFSVGNVMHVTYAFDNGARGMLGFLETFRKKEYYQPVPGALTVNLPADSKFSTVRESGRLSKTIIKR